jgi:alkanesulfonate monooxygenase SsuD/methylene tetrahydromethanopterin reductase-like flavin-dependent oxidoreductase (luciferase family)
MNMADPGGHENHPLECWTTLAGLAASTSRIALGPLVSCVNYRHPTVLAKMATTVDIVSGGRLIFGIGAGWREAEFLRDQDRCRNASTIGPIGRGDQGSG